MRSNQGSNFWAPIDRVMLYIEKGDDEPEDWDAERTAKERYRERQARG